MVNDLVRLYANKSQNGDLIMTQKHTEVNQDVDVVQKFNSGLEKWERPFGDLSAELKGRATPVPRKESASIITRGAVRSKLPQFGLPDDDETVRQFTEGLNDWESPLK
jgi:hypothetical protein